MVEKGEERRGGRARSSCPCSCCTWAAIFCPGQSPGLLFTFLSLEPCSNPDPGHPGMPPRIPRQVYTNTIVQLHGFAPSRSFSSGVFFQPPGCAMPVPHPLPPSPFPSHFQILPVTAPGGFPSLTHLTLRNCAVHCLEAFGACPKLELFHHDCFSRCRCEKGWG